MARVYTSSWKKYTDRGVRKILARYAEKAGLERPISPHKMRHFLFTWLKKQGVDDAIIRPYSGHESRKSLEVYPLIAIGEAQERSPHDSLSVTGPTCSVALYTSQRQERPYALDMGRGYAGSWMGT